jgi:DNA-binding transcriptional MerR regulator
MKRPPSWDEDGDPISDLRYEPELTTRDVADLFRVTQATVRQWVARGYLSPTRQVRSSNVFDTEEVFEAFDLIAARRKATGQARRSEGYFAKGNRADRIPSKHYDAIITISEAARLVQVSPATIRSWMHRGYLTPANSFKPRRIRLRVEDVIKATRARRLPQPVPAGRRRNQTR